MTERQIDAVKKVGLRETLYREASSKLWDARRCTETALSDECKNYIRQLQEAKNRIDDAWQLLDEMFKIAAS